MNRPILGISMGDPFGNGPEITVKALADKTVYDRCRPLVVGDASSMAYAVRAATPLSLMTSIRNSSLITSWQTRRSI